MKVMIFGAKTGSSADYASVWCKSVFFIEPGNARLPACRPRFPLRIKGCAVV